jgi:hypothetical protein
MFYFHTFQINYEAIFMHVLSLPQQDPKPLTGPLSSPLSSVSNDLQGHRQNPDAQSGERAASPKPLQGFFVLIELLGNAALFVVMLQVDKFRKVRLSIHTCELTAIVRLQKKCGVVIVVGYGMRGCPM